MEAGSGVARAIAAGPYASEISVGADGSLYALLVSSVEAPITARAVRVASTDGAEQALLADADLVYRLASLATGGFVGVVHRLGGGVELRPVNGGPALTVLDAASGDVDISPDGRRAAWVEAGRVLVADIGSGSASASRPLGDASHPRFSPDGQLVLAEGPAGALVIGLDGQILARLRSGACWVATWRGCGS